MEVFGDTFRSASYGSLAGWAIGSGLGIPLGILMGDIRFVRNFLNPYLQFFRFIPPISFVTLSLIWFGMGETSKIVLIIYTTIFIVTVNTIAGVMSVNPIHVQGALMSGSQPVQDLYEGDPSLHDPFSPHGDEAGHGKFLYDDRLRGDDCSGEGTRISHLHLQTLHADREDLCRDRLLGDSGVCRRLCLSFWDTETCPAVSFLL